MSFKARVFIPVLMLVIGVASGSLFKGFDAKTPESAVAQRTYALNVVFSSWPGWKASTNTLDRISASTPGLSYMFGGPPDGDTGKQIEELESLINRKVNGIILHSGDPVSLRHTVDKAAAAGIPVVTYFGDVEGSARLTFVGGDERGSGRRLAQKVLNSIKRPPEGGAPVKVLASYPKPGITCSEDRLAGVKEAIEALPWVKFLGVVSDQADDSKGAEAITAAWNKNEGIDVIFGLGGRSAVSAISALKELGSKPGQVVVTGWDADIDTLQGIRDGWLIATSVPNFPFMIEVSVEALEAYHLALQGTARPRFPQRVEIEQTYVDKSNVEEFVEGVMVAKKSKI